MILATVRGRIGSDAVLRFSNGGLPILSWSVASNRKVKNEDETTWVRCTAFGDLAEQFSQKPLTRGMYIEVRGKMGSRTWTDRKGQTRVDLDLTCDQIILEPKRPEEPTERRAASVRPSPVIPEVNPQVSFSDDDIPF